MLPGNNRGAHSPTHTAGRAILDELELTRAEVLRDYRLAWESRHASLIGRREVMSGKAKFGIFGDGKELPQIALAKVFRQGDFRSGYYRDQTIMLATGATTLQALFAQLYAHADRQAEPASGGRQMNAHFATPLLDDRGDWLDQTGQVNSSGDLSPTGSQMPRLVGLAQASTIYRRLSSTSPDMAKFSSGGNEVAFGTIGNASCAEGMFWESINAIGVLKAPAVISIWDDGYGISVPNEYQVVKQDIGMALQGFQRSPESEKGFDIHVVRGWDYPALVRTYREAAGTARKHHIPAIIHVKELTQPQGHSTSGSHERYKSENRLDWEAQHDCLVRLRAWILEHEIASEAELKAIEEQAQTFAEHAREEAWNAYRDPILEEIETFEDILAEIPVGPEAQDEIKALITGLKRKTVPLRMDLAAAAHRALMVLRTGQAPGLQVLADWRRDYMAVNDLRYGSHLYSESDRAALAVEAVPPVFTEKSVTVHGYQVMNACFDAILARDPSVVAFGEDVGRIGDVNQGFAGLQERYGSVRVSDTGIREATILGQAIGLAIRGLRPIAEIQYLDYLLYALQIMSDDLATLRWRTAGRQAAPVIVRTRGHRLEGVWHSGSLMAGIIHLLRGVHVLVPRDMVQAAGFYNTLLASDDPGLVVEVLNGYRLKERMPENLAEMRIPVGVPEIIRPGKDITLVTYGASCRVVLQAAEMLLDVGVDPEVIDVRSLLPFDVHGRIAESLRKTNRVVFIDEDVPGGTTAYMLQEVLEKQRGYRFLDSPPATLSAKPHRPAYGSDGNYWSKPNAERIFDTVYGIMHEVSPRNFPPLL